VSVALDLVTSETVFQLAETATNTKRQNIHTITWKKLGNCSFKHVHTDV